LDNNSLGYPNHQLDSRSKDSKWILQYVKAAFSDSRGYIPSNYTIVGGVSKYAEIRQYALGKQSVDKYKKQALPTDQQDNSAAALDFTPLSILPKYREIAISKILQNRYDIQAFAVDPLARSEEDEYFNEMKVKIMLREQFSKMGVPELAEQADIKVRQGEPEDEEQLKIEKEFGYKHVMAMEAEELNALILGQNDAEELRKRVIENLYDFGIGGYTQWIDENGKVRIREVNPENLVLSYCVKNNFSDLVHWGEVIEVFVGDLAPYFTKDQLNDIVKSVAGKNGNAQLIYGNELTTYWSRFKALVLDFKFKSWNSTFYETEVDGRGNDRFKKTKPPTGFDKTVEETGQTGLAKPEYKSITREVVYKCRWVLGTDFIYDYGLSENMVRKQSDWAVTSLDIQLYSWNFYKMQFGGVTERLMPLEDAASLTWYKLQNLKNKLVPYLINLDMGAFENINFGKGGGKASPEEAIEFVFNNYVVPHRSSDLLKQNPNYKPVSIEASGQLVLFGQYYEDLNQIVNMMRQVSGLNEITDGSTPNAKNLNSTNEAALASTNNALYLIMSADKYLWLKLADANIEKGKLAVKLGNVEGYNRALGKETVKFLKINPDISNHEFGIFIEDAPSEQQRQMFWQSLNAKEYQGLIEPSDKILVMSIRNLKQADMVLAYKIKKRKEEMQQNEMAKIQAQQQGNEQAQMLAIQAKQQELELDTQSQIAVINAQMQWQYIIEKMKKEQSINEAKVHAESKIIATQIASDASLMKEQMKPKPIIKAKAN